MNKTVQDVLNSKGITTGPQAYQHLGGKTVVMAIGTSYGKKGTRIKVDSSWLFSPNCGTGQNGYMYLNTNGAALYFSQVHLDAQTVEDIKAEIVDNAKRIKEIETNTESLKIRIQFMEENDMKEYDEDTFKVYETLKLIAKKGMTEIDKAKTIARLIKG